MRINTEGKYAFRREVIEKAAEYYDCNRTDAIVNACDDVPELVDAVTDILRRQDLTLEQKREIAERLNDCRAVEFNVDQSVIVEKDP